jgi:hypothetical protein
VNRHLRFLIGWLALIVIPAGGCAMLLIPSLPLDLWSWLIVLLLWISASAGYVAVLGTMGFWAWVLRDPKPRLIIPRPCRCGMAFPARDRLYHSVVREEDMRLRLACTGGTTGHVPFYILGRKGLTVAEVPPGDRCPRPGCVGIFESEIHPACPQHGRHRIEPA